MPNAQAVRGVNSATSGINFGGVFGSIGSGASYNTGLFATVVVYTLKTLY